MQYRSNIYKTVAQQIWLCEWDIKLKRFQCWRRTHPCVPVSNQWLAAYPVDSDFLLFTPVSIPRRVTSQVTLEGTSPRTMQQCHCGARLAQCGSSSRPQAFVIWRRRSGEQAQFTANPLPKKAVWEGECREATLAPVASRSIIPKPRSGRSSNPLKPLPHIYTVCALPTASDKTISYWDL